MQASVLGLRLSSAPPWPAAVSPLVAEVVAGAVQQGTVLGVFPTCVYLRLSRHDEVVALLARDAVALPIGLRLGVPSADVRWGVSAADPVEVGAGRVRLPGTEVVAARFLPPTHSRVLTSCRVRGGRTCALGSGGGRVCTWCREGGGRTWALDWGGGVLADLARELAAAALAAEPVRDVLGGLLGAGRGLTPSGDDAVCGVLLTLRAAGALEAATRLGAEVRARNHATTSLSAALLNAAAEGYAAPEVVALVGLLHHAGPTDRHDQARSEPPSTIAGPQGGSWRSVGPPPLEEALRRVLAIGHSSGRDLVAGIAGAHRALADSLPAALSPTTPTTTPRTPTTEATPPTTATATTTRHLEAVHA